MVRKKKSSMVLKQKERARARDEKISGEHFIEQDPAETRGTTAHAETDSSSSDEGDPGASTYPSTRMSQLALRGEQTQQGTLQNPMLEVDDTLWELRKAPGKGLGMFARKHIPRGTRILADECLFNLPAPVALYIDIERTFDRLSKRQQEAYKSLVCPDRPGRSPVVRIWEANCFRMGQGGGIFLRASRINHSCTPNANFSWNARIRRETVHAIVDIPANEEITITYCRPHADIYHRQKSLEPYGFDCTCTPCSQDTAVGRAREARRCRMAELLEEINNIREDPKMANERHWREDELRTRLKLINLLGKESLFQIELGNQYSSVATCYLYRRDNLKALEYARKGLQIDLWCVGPDSDAVHDDQARIQELKEVCF